MSKFLAVSGDMSSTKFMLTIFGNVANLMEMTSFFVTKCVNTPRLKYIDDDSSCILSFISFKSEVKCKF